MFDKLKSYINSKTNSILKTNILRNNRDVVATIVYNELTDLLDYSLSNNPNLSLLLLNSDAWLWERDLNGSILLEKLKINSYISTGIDSSISTNIARIHKLLYTDKPFTLLKYCEECNDCCKYDKPQLLPDCFILGLLLEDGTPFEQEQTDDGIFLIEKQRYSECYGKELISDKYPNEGLSCNSDELRFTVDLNCNIVKDITVHCVDCEYQADTVLALLTELNEPIEYELNSLGIMLLENQRLILRDNIDYDCDYCVNGICSLCNKI